MNLAFDTQQRQMKCLTQAVCVCVCVRERGWAVVSSHQVEMVWYSPIRGCLLSVVCYVQWMPLDRFQFWEM